MCQPKRIRLSRRDLVRATADVRSLRRVQEPASRLGLVGIVENVLYVLKKEKIDYFFYILKTFTRESTKMVIFLETKNPFIILDELTRENVLAM